VNSTLNVCKNKKYILFLFFQKSVCCAFLAVGTEQQNNKAFMLIILHNISVIGGKRVGGSSLDQIE